MGFKRWSEIRDKHIAHIGLEEHERRVRQLYDEVRAYQLKEVRKRKGMPQREVAEIMGVTIGRVSQIEKGMVTGVDVLRRYVAALGGTLELHARFGDGEDDRVQLADDVDAARVEVAEEPATPKRAARAPKAEPKPAKAKKAEPEKAEEPKRPKNRQQTDRAHRKGGAKTSV